PLTGLPGPRRGSRSPCAVRPPITGPTAHGERDGRRPRPGRRTIRCPGTTATMYGRARCGRSTTEARGEAMDDGSEGFTRLDDSALLTGRAQARAALERLPPASPDHAALSALYDQSTEVVNDRARRAWSSAK